MPCVPFSTPDGARGFMCTTRGPRKRCACGKPATQECDWKVKGKKSGTCDRPICKACSHVPAPDKDLCPTHAAEWKARSS